MKKRILIHPDFGEISILKSGKARRISIKVDSDCTIQIIIPSLLPYKAGELFLKQSHKRVSEILEQQKRKKSEKIELAVPSDPHVYNTFKREASVFLSKKTTELALLHHFTRDDEKPLFNKITIKNIKSRFGSCSTNKNINLNIRIYLLPPHLRDYIILHELCHLIHFNHGKEFHQLLDKVSGGNDRNYAKEIKKYRII